jgi:hypothetical protein
MVLVMVGVHLRVGMPLRGRHHKTGSQGIKRGQSYFFCFAFLS